LDVGQIPACPRKLSRPSLFYELRRGMVDLEDVRVLQRRHSMCAPVEPCAENDDLLYAIPEGSDDLGIDRERANDEKIDSRDNPLARSQRKQANRRSEPREQARPGRRKQCARGWIAKALC
jgi:hypothetical protein